MTLNKYLMESNRWLLLETHIFFYCQRNFHLDIPYLQIKKERERGLPLLDETLFTALEHTVVQALSASYRKSTIGFVITGSRRFNIYIYIYLLYSFDEYSFICKWLIGNITFSDCHDRLQKVFSVHHRLLMNWIYREGFLPLI